MARNEKEYLLYVLSRVHPLDIGIASGKREHASPQEEKDELGQRYMHCRQGPDMQHTGERDSNSMNRRCSGLV